MKLGFAVVALLLAFGASSVDAGIFGLGRKSKFPKPIDFPVVRPKVRENHKPGSRVKHLSLGSDAAVVSDVARA
jgi:hypothetical protein